MTVINTQIDVCWIASSNYQRRNETDNTCVRSTGACIIQWNSKVNSRYALNLYLSYIDDPASDVHPALSRQHRMWKKNPSIRPSSKHSCGRYMPDAVQSP